MELEPKINKVELIRDCDKNHLEPQALKEYKLYLNHIKSDRIRIKNLFECFPPNPAKRQLQRSSTCDSETNTKRQNRRASITTSRGKDEKSDRACPLSKQRDRDLIEDHFGS